jgi:sugar-specific transcriptional regulator TrmB
VITADNEENTLVNLGLTSLQAKVYLVLAHNGPLKVNAISKLSNIHRTHLYEILKFLEEHGFIEKQLSTGDYSAMEFQEIAASLLNSRREATAKLEDDIAAIAKTIPQHNISDEETKKKELILSPSKTSNFAKSHRYINQATHQINQIHTWKRFTQFWNLFEEQMTEVMNRGVKVQQVIELPPGNNIDTVEKYLKNEIFKNPNFEYRLVPKTGGNLTIIDGETVMLSTSQDKENLGETPLIFSNYEGLLGLMQSYYGYCWKYGYQLKNGELTPQQPQHATTAQV